MGPSMRGPVGGDLLQVPEDARHDMVHDPNAGGEMCVDLIQNLVRPGQLDDELEPGEGQGLVDAREGGPPPLLGEAEAWGLWVDVNDRQNLQVEEAELTLLEELENGVAPRPAPDERSLHRGPPLMTSRTFVQ